MSLRIEQSLFAIDVLNLFIWLRDNGYEWTLGEAFRTPEQQAIYVKAGRSKTFNSFHLKRCAIDLFIFKNGKLLTTKEEMQHIGNYWETLYVKNSWGGNWNSFKDIPHFERRV